MIQLHETPIYTQLKIEQQVEALKPAMQAAGEALQRIIDAFRPFIDHVLGIAKAMHRYDMSAGQPVRRPGMKPLLKNGRKP